MPDKKYLIEIPDMPDSSGVWDADKWERNKDKFMQKYPTANVFELGAYDPNDMDENDQFMLTFDNDEESSGVWDAAKWERNKDKFLAKYPDAHVNRVRYMDYWGDKAKSDQARIAELQQPDEERNARLAEIGYYDDSAGTQVDYANYLGFSPLSSAIEQNSVSGEVTYLDPRVEEFFANDTEYTDRQMELNRLRDEYEANPRVIEQREYEAQMARYAEELEKQIKADMEADVDAYHAGQGAAAKHMQDASGANQTIQAIRMLKGEDVGKDVIENEKQERYASALKLLQQAKDARNVAGKGMAGGVVDTAKDWARNLGTQSDIEMYNEVGNILTALEQKVGNLNEVSDEVIEENLTNDEKALIRAFFEYNAAMADAGEDMSIWYKGGKIFAESIPFMMEFLVTGGLANTAGRAATSWMGKGFGKWIAKSAKGTAARAAKKVAAKTVSGVAKTVVAAGARTLAAPTTYKNIAEQSVQYGADGHLDREGNMVKAAVDSYIEQLSEMSGAAFGKVLGGVGRLALGKTAFEKVGAWFGNNAVMQNLSKLGFHGLPEEVGEEIFGNALRTITGVDEEALSRMFEKDEFASMIIGFAPMTLFGAGMSMAKMGAVSIGAANAGRRMRQDLSRSYTEEQIDQVEMALDEAKDANEIANAIRPIIMGMQAAGAPLHEVQSVWDYAIAVAKKKAMVSAQSAQEMQLAQAKIGEAQERMGGRFWIEDKDGVKSVKQVVLNNGNTAYVVSEPDQDGRVAIINATTGQKGTALPEDIKEESWNGTLNAFGSGLVMADRTQREQQRMQEDRAAQINEVRNRLSADPRINVGTEGSPIYLVAQSFNDAGVRYVAQDGSTGNISWEQAADSIGMPIIVKTDAQIAQEEAETLVAAAAERRAMRAKKDAVGTTERDNAVVDAENAVAGANEAARHIPMNEDGTVNEAAFWEQSPEEYVKWNDEQNQDGGQDSLQQVAIAKQELMGLLQEANAAQNTSNPTTRKAAKKEVERLADRIARLDAIEQSYMQSLEEEKAAVQQTAATPTSSMSEEDLESMDAQYQGILGKTRVQGERVRVMQEYLDKLAEGSMPIKVLTADNYAEVMKAANCPEADIARVGKAITRAAKKGSKVAGFASAGTTFIMADTISNIEEARITYVHERQHLLNSQNPEAVKMLANALVDKETALRVLEKFVGKNGLEEYKNDTLLKLADEILCRSIELVYSTENYSVDLQEKGLSNEAINIINSINNEQRTDKSLAAARRSSHANGLGRENAEENGRNSQQVSGGILGGEEVGSLGSSGRGDRIGGSGEPAEVISETSDDEEPSSPFMAAAQQEGESIRFSITTEESLQDKIRKFAKTKDGKKTGWTEDDIESIIAETESLIDAIHRSSTGNEFYDEFAYKEPTIRVDWRDGEAKPIVTWTRANIEYKYDMSADLLCINNEGLEQVLSSDKMVALMEMFIPEKKAKKGEPIIKFTAEDYLELYNTLRDLGFVVPCKGCFDAAGRFKMLPSVAQKFAAEVNAVIDERNKDPKAFDEKLKAKAGEETTIEGLPTTASTKSAAIAVGVAGDNLTEHVKWTQLMSADGQTKMLSDWGGIFRAWQRTGAGRPKDKLLPEPYYGDIVSSVSTIIGKYGEKTPSFRDTLVNQGTGLRRNSHSEFRPVLAIDEIQFMRDAFIRNLTVFKYMKELDDVRLFGKMGVKFNMSFFPEYVPGTKVAGLDKEGNYIASEESVGSREFPYQGEDGKRHYDGMKGWAEAQKYVNKDVSLSSVIFSIPHLLKALTDVPTPSDMRGIWGSLIPFHSSGATTASLAMQGLGMARANGVGHGFIEAFTDYGKGVTNFEAVQNDRFGEGWYIVSGKKAGTDVEPGHKLEFANGNHYYNRTLGIHLFASGYILDAELPEGVLGEKGELNITDEQKKTLMHKFTIDYNDKVRELKGPYAYKAAADFYIAELPKLGLIPRFDFEVSEEKFLEMCEAANVDPRHPKLGWKGEGNSWSPIDSEAYYSLFCDYGMTDPATGEWAPHMPVGYVNEEGQREFRLPENAVEIVKDGLERFSEVRRSEAGKIDEAIKTFAQRSVEKGRIKKKDAEKIVGELRMRVSSEGPIDLVEEAKKAQAKHDAKEIDVRFRVLDTTNAKLKEKPIKLNGMYRFKLKNAFKGVKDNGGSYPYIKVQLEEVPEDYPGEKIAYNGILEGFAVVRIPKGLITEGEKDNVFFIDPKAIENELWDVLRATENYYEFKHGGAPYQRDWMNADEVRFRVTPEQDKAYMDAVKAGDMETAQRMVIEAARLAMPNTKVVDENGNPKVVYHGSTAMFTIFDKSRIGSATGTADGRGFYFTTDRDYALGYKTPDGQLFEVFLNIEKPLSYDKKTITKAQLRKILKEADRVEYEQEGEHYMLSNYANYNDVGIDGAVNEGANLEYDYADNDVELVGSLIGGSGSFDLIMDAVKKVTGKSGMIAPKDNGTIHYVVTDPAGIKSADPVTYDDQGNVIPLSQRFNPENEDIRFRMSNNNQAIFVSNAARAVEGIKQEKATPEQWLKMIEKNGGLKAGEDKWMGLSDWLKASDKKTLTKQEVLDYINENMIIIEEQHYSDEEVAASANKELNDKYPGWEDAFSMEWDTYMDEPYASIWDNETAVELYNDTHEEHIELDEDGEFENLDDESKVMDFGKELAEIYYRGNTDVRPIHGTRSDYQTRGLSDNHEIALTVPAIESWRPGDAVHFGDAGDGRAIAWIRFGETKYRPDGIADEVAALDKAILEYEGETSDDEYKALVEKKHALLRASRAQKVLVIDEIQSKRHQEGREKGYFDIRDRKAVNATRDAVGQAAKARDDYKQMLDEKYGVPTTLKSKMASKEEIAELKRLRAEVEKARAAMFEAQEKANIGGIPDAPFDKNWHELAMKRMLRYAAENGYDVIAWTTGDQQNQRYGLSKVVDHIQVGMDFTKNVESSFRMYLKNGNDHHVGVNRETGLVTFYNENPQAIGKPLSDVLGKELADKVLGARDYQIFTEVDFELSEGMRGFYDKMLPAFMNKYGKRWGVKVEDINLPNLGKYGYTMHSIPVTEEMKASVMEGQVMFRMRGKNETIQEFFESAVSDYKAKYTELGTLMALPVDDITAMRFGFTLEQLQKINGLYESGTDIIAIFAHKRIEDTILIENTIFHEDIHYIASFYPHMDKLGKWLMENADIVEAFAEIRDEVETYYEESKRPQEMLCRIVSLAMTTGTTSELDMVVPYELQNIVRQIENEIGYDRGTEESSRKAQWLAQHTGSEEGSEPSAREHPDGRRSDEETRLTAEERRIINEYFPGAFPEEDNDTQPDNTGEFSEGEGDIRFSIRTKPAPKKTGKGYKVFYLKDGKLYPPMVANLGGVDTPVGVWLDAEEGTRAGVSKTGRPKVKQGGKGTQGGSGTLAYRPGWHLGEIPYAIQFNRKDENGDRTLFPADFVWAEVEYANDVDYQEEAMSYGMNANGKFQHSLAGLPKLPIDGSYRYRTNPNPETDPWIITGAMKVNRLLTPSEVDQMVVDAGREPQKRQEGAVTDEQIEALNKELGLVEEEEEVSFRTTGTPTEDVVAEGVSLSPAQLASLAGDIFAALPEDGRKKITDGLNGNILGLQDAILQIPTSLATKEEWNDEDRQMAEVVAEQMTKAVGIEMTRPFSASEALWTLYNAVNKSTDLVSEASRALVRRNLGMGQSQSTLDSVQFRTSDSFESIDEIVNNGKQKVSDENSASAIELMTKLNSINATLAQIRSITAAQKEYDKATVKIVSDLANKLLEKGALSDMTRNEIKRLLSAIKDAVGKKDLSVSVERLMDIMIANQLRHGRDRFKQILKIRDKRVDQRGIEVRGKLDVNGQRVMDALREGIGLDLERLEDRINETLNKMFDASDVVKKNAENELAGYELAKLYLQNIKESEQEEKDLRKELKDAKEVYDGGGMSKDAYREFVQSIYAAIRENRMQRVNDYANLFAEVTKMVTESTAKASLLRDAEKARVERIHHYANSDMQGMPSVQQGEVKSSFWNNTILRFLFKPLATFDQMLRSFAPKSRNGEGYLWNHFMGGWLRSSENEFKGIQAAHEQLDAKVRSMFAGVKRWSDLFSIEKKLPTMEVKFWDGEKMADFTLTQGNLLYIYMVNKMTDGEMKLRKMGITEEDVSNIARELDPRFIELADWIQDTFLPGLREKYNTLHEKMFGAPMAAIDNYFPIRVLANARTREVDLAVEESSAKPSTITGSIIKRTKNSLALDILGSDAFDVVLEHIEQMEHWAAFAEFNRDLNTLLSYRKFRNRVQNMRGIYGAGTTVWNNFRSVAEIAAGVYKPAVKGDSLDKLITNIAKGVTGAKISFRVYTALKQFLSAPAFISDASAVELIKSLANPYKAWTWAMKELPLFEKRWKSRQAGDSRLMETESDWKLWKNKIVELAGRYGMTPNAFVDALTVSIGARAIYETKRKEYVKLGYTQDQAEEKAKRDATVLFNESQQSNESAFLSAAQVDRTVASILITVFRNSSMGYQRMYVDALRNIKHMLKKGYKAESLEYMKKQMMRDGLTEDQAERAANRIYNRSFARSATRLATFGFLVQFAWNLGPYMAYLLMGDDDDEKKDMIKDAAVRGLVGGPVEGLAAGQAISGVLGDFAMSEEISDPMLKLPATSDMESIFRQLEVDPVRAVNDIFNLVIQSGIGVNPQTLTDAVVAIIDGCNGDLETSKEAAFALMRILQTPQSQIEKLYMEEIDFTAEEALDMSVREFAERYAKYKVMRTAPLTKWMYSDEKEKELEDKYIKTFTKKASEMERTHGTEEAQEFFEYYDSEYEETSETLRDLKKQLKEAILDSDTEGEAKANEDIDSFLESEEFKRFEELLPHIKAYEAYRKALKTIDDPKTRSEYTEKMIQERNAAVEILRGE